MTDQTVFCKIPNRGLIKLSGHDSMPFLQGLISNDVTLLKNQLCLYSCLLTPNGKFLYDFFLIRDGDNILIECEGGARAESLLKRLQIFKLRANVQFDLQTEINIYSFDKGDGYFDPRHPDMGLRSLKHPSEARETAFENWDKKRISLGIPDGSRDMIPEKSTLLECNINQFNGVDFKKGCYMGQELTARMHYRGLTKKTLIPLKFKHQPPAPFTDLRDNEGTLIGEMRSSCDNLGLALLKKSNLSFSSDEYEIYSY